MISKPKAFALAFVLSSGMLGYAGICIAASDHDHGHAKGATALQLDEATRWATDAPLRKAMGKVNESMRRALPAIHENRLAAVQYGQLAVEVRSQVAYMVENCKLGAKADAQLHLIITRLLAGADAMADTRTQRDGAITVVGALGDYATYFADDTFTPIKH